MAYKTVYSKKVYSSSDSQPGVDSSFSFSSNTPTRIRQFVAVDPPGRDRDDSGSYSRTFSSTSSNSSSNNSSGNGGPGVNKKVYTKKTETTTRDTGSGPQTHSYTTESTRTDGATPSFFSSAAYKTPTETSFRHFTYK